MSDVLVFLLYTQLPVPVKLQVVKVYTTPWPSRLSICGGFVGEGSWLSTFWFETESWLHTLTDSVESQWFCFGYVDFQKNKMGGIVVVNSPDVLFWS